jgi:hypothetical protein
MQTDIDGKYTYSSIISINLGNKNAGISVYPNPATDLIRISFSSAGRYEVSVLNISGQLMNKSVLVTGNSTVLDVHDLKEGIYFVLINHDGKNETWKILINK